MLAEVSNEIIPELVRSIGSNLLSVFVVGSMAKEDYIFRDNNDLDLRFILQNVTTDAYLSINRIINKYTISSSNDKLDITAADIIGPARYVSDKKQCLLVHYIVFDKNTLNGLSKLHKHSYSQNYKILFGNDYIKDFLSIRYDAENICNDVEGIYYCIRMLNDRKLKYQRWVESENEMILMDFEEDMNDVVWVETLRYSLLKTFYNCVEFLNWKGYEFDNGNIRDVLIWLSIDIKDDMFEKYLKLVKRDYASVTNLNTTITYFTGILEILAKSLLNMKQLKK